jgi:hypothetical protein
VAVPADQLLSVPCPSGSPTGERPLTAEPAMAEDVPLTSEPPLVAEPSLISEPMGTLEA